MYSKPHPLFDFHWPALNSHTVGCTVRDAMIDNYGQQVGDNTTPQFYCAMKTSLGNIHILLIVLEILINFFILKLFIMTMMTKPGFHYYGNRSQKPKWHTYINRYFGIMKFPQN